MEDLASYIDHTLLKPDATKEQVDQLIKEAKQYKFASVCVNPYWVPYCAKGLKGSDVRVCTVIGFPLGANTTATKVYESKKAIADGATEIDMVINIGELKSGNFELVREDIAAVVEAAGESAWTKVIIETSLLTHEEKVSACVLAKEAQADFVKTSTGFSGGGATMEDIRLMRKTVGEDMGVKASGGVRDLQTVKGMIASGATRIGASAGVAIMKENGENE
ncbi:deoxyribose-phosphate aldolase [Virgibacillus halophilus]|uniref:Deoxyribose-phosphate aldolase n=1 Tax=Tigheibacillus halophilus TaxID=361280 RepID=A0ABU5CBL0_9BACI|nr:deoxyribose-phosphate aldolase [Virgibacillus halophilus]